MKPLLRAALLTGAVLLAVGLWWTGRQAATAAADPALEEMASLLPVEGLRVVELDGYVVATRYAGRVVARRQSELGFDRGGRLVSVAVDEGDAVLAGQVLASLDVRELRARRREIDAQVAASRARVTETEARLALARRTTERRRELLSRETISAQRFDESRFEEEALAAKLAAAQADIAAARSARTSVDVALDLSVLKAPYAGSITARMADEGTVVSPGQRILTLVEDGVLEVRIGLPPAASAWVVPTASAATTSGGRPMRTSSTPWSIPSRPTPARSPPSSASRRGRPASATARSRAYRSTRRWRRAACGSRSPPSPRAAAVCGRPSRSRATRTARCA